MSDLSSDVFSQINDIVSDFYEASLGHVPWSQPLGKTSALLDASAGVFSLHDPLTRQSEFVFGQFGTDPDFSRSFEETYSIISPFSVATLLAEVGQVAKPFDLIGREEVLQSRFFKEWCAPQGYNDFIGAVVAREPRATYALAFVRLADQPIFDRKVTELLELLIPHIMRAVRISDQLKTMTSKQSDLVTTMDTLPSAVVLMDSSRNILHINKAARSLAQSGDAITLEGGRLSLRDQGDQERLLAALRDCSHVATTLNIKGIQPRVMQIVAQSGDAMPDGFGRGRGTVVIIHPTNETAPPPGLALKERFGLTVAELRVLTLLVAGGTRETISHDLGISLATVKTHIQNLFSKTGTNRQADLIRIVLGGPQSEEA